MWTSCLHKYIYTMKSLWTSVLLRMRYLVQSWNYLLYLYVSVCYEFASIRRALNLLFTQRYVNNCTKFYIILITLIYIKYHTRLLMKHAYLVLVCIFKSQSLCCSRSPRHSFVLNVMCMHNIAQLYISVCRSSMLISAYKFAKFTCWLEGEFIFCV